jgi:steroid 5-alpha reductase family enzyme
VAALTLLLSGEITARKGIVTVLVFIWGIRLATHVFLRNKGKPEDYRYANWRNQWGKWFVWRSYFQIFILQGILLLIVASPIVLVNRSLKTGLSLLDIFGVLIWCVGFSFESVSDYQLARFKQDPSHKGRIMTSGLWRYSRHPNYFGEVLLWWGIFIIALSVEYGWAALASPLLVTFLLLKVSGVAMLEKKYTGHAEFEAYAKKTSAFIPWFPKSKE